MILTQCTRVLALALIAPAVGAAIPPQQLSPSAAVAVQGSVEPGLGAMRAGRAEAPSPLGAQERAELAAAEQQATDLATLRAGELSDKEWTWLAIGAGIVLLIVLL